MNTTDVPLISIIIPVYNGSDFLSQAIETAVNQTYTNIEIIVVNDGSTDNGMSEKIALSYGDRIKYYAKENGGVSSALNYALERMSGEWFSWLSHDDLYYPQKIEKQIEFINSLPKTVTVKNSVIHCATESIDKNGKVIKTPNYSDVEIVEDTLTTIVGNVFNYRLSGCSFLIPYDCYKEFGGFREDIRTVSDVEYWYRLLFGGCQFYCMKNDILVQNRSHGKQVGKTKVSLFDEEIEKLHIQIVDKLATYINGNDNRVIEKFYLGLVKRGMKKAAQYTMDTYLQNNMNLSIQSVYYCLLGRLRNLARDIFRRIRVK